MREGYECARSSDGASAPIFCKIQLLIVSVDLKSLLEDGSCSCKGARDSLLLLLWTCIKYAKDFQEQLLAISFFSCRY